MDPTVWFKNRNFGENPNSGQKLKFWSKIESFCKTRNF